MSGPSLRAPEALKALRQAGYWADYSFGFGNIIVEHADDPDLFVLLSIIRDGRSFLVRDFDVFDQLMEKAK